MHTRMHTHIHTHTKSQLSPFRYTLQLVNYLYSQKLFHLEKTAHPSLAWICPLSLSIMLPPTINMHGKDISQVQQQRPERPMVTLTWHACKYKVHKLHHRYILCIKVQYFLPQSISHIQTLTFYEDNKVLFYLIRKSIIFYWNAWANRKVFRQDLS